MSDENNTENIGESTEQTSWLDSVSESLRGNPTLQKYDSQEAALKALVHAQELIGRKGLVAPAEDASDEAVAAYRAARRGGVQTPAGYKEPSAITAEKLQELGFDSRALEGMRETAFDIGLDADGYRAFVGRAVQNVERTRKDILAQQQEQADAVKKTFMAEWGDDYEQRVSDHRALLEGAELLDIAEATGLTRNEKFIRFIDEAVKTVKSEGKLPKGATGGQSPLDMIRSITDSGAASDFRNPARSSGAIKNYEEAIGRLAQQSRGNNNFIAL